MVEEDVSERADMIRYSDIINESVVDGAGVRVVAFLQGCPRACEGCHNPTLQPAEGGQEETEERFAARLLGSLTPLHRGLTFSGGDPLLQAEALQRVLSIVKMQRSDMDIWVYTGYVFEQVRELPVMQLIDVLVDGPFILAKRDLKLAFRGSTNQRVIDVQQSLSQGQAVVKPL